ncbi:MAG: 50S ribosomal protein L19, partial [cyanobacterium endosymbiont of Rhopalodia fuxianensis]
MNAQETIRSIETEYIKTNLPTIHVGDTVRVGVRIREGGK